ncbi:glycosyltransferase family 4 protein [Fibrella aquatica]|uniref:glycosyltransferase family 4 protein n=1 Tax=Fibrella aquatica TaxID=3242487 RepID=UPI00352209C6
MKKKTVSNLPETSLTLVIVSSCPEVWGGSEELWAQSAVRLSGAGHQVHVYKTNVDSSHPRIQALRLGGCTVTDLHQLLPWPVRLRNRLLPNRWRYAGHRARQVLQRALSTISPDLTIVAQGNNFDGTEYADACRQGDFPYVLIAQKAVHFFFPQDVDRAKIQDAYRAARYCFFVSRHNQALTRQQLCLPLLNSAVVNNPVHISLQQATSLPPAPTHNGVFRLACVARLDVLDKGQDLLLNVLSLPAWRARPIQVTFFGDGPHAVALQELVAFLHLEDQVRFGGLTNPAAIWKTHHALVLASRSEGLPLAMVEAMLCGRPVIATNAGGIAELLTDNITGFLAETPSVAALNEALERAWNRRDEWEDMGGAAARHVREVVPKDVVDSFCQQLLQIIEQQPTTQRYEPTSNFNHHSNL